ncbi:glycosyltransferase 25 family member [Toxorhynchites rutilus septentrionalis]|uniref:glycosyltransferase 25 family member n=1 Tax=Toxorhynchites rutilus septentrionalis TaxID=329112 RepID=UPI00247AD678|nr:glycosyltransferase 25 family member [Toxorhynchites rutilus septentrionalis]
MNSPCWILVPLAIVLNSVFADVSFQKPKVLIATLIRNKEHTLPFFFSYLESLDYPKDRISLWIRSDHNEDRSIEITKHWLKKASRLYHSVDFGYRSDVGRRKDEESSLHWSEERFADVIRLKEEALNKGRKMWADYLFFLDADVFLTNPDALNTLVDLNLPIVAPMLLSDGLYSNFWCGMTTDYYYHRTDDYKQILNYDKTGQFPVPMVHSAVMVNLNVEQSLNLTFEKKRLTAGRYHGPQDDIIIFAMSANFSGIPMYISNSALYGFILFPLEQGETVKKDFEQLTNTKVYIVNEYGALKIKDDMKQFIPDVPKDKLSLSHIYMINLERRPLRRRQMFNNYDVLGLDVEYFPAVDGKKLNDDVLREIGIEFLPGYTDPYHKRPMTMGEIGCFLSHYYIWERMVELDQQEVLVLEDDIRFEPYFKRRVRQVLDDARRIGGWDLIYLGRKRLQEEDEKWINTSDNLVKAGYSYWTLGYIITLDGAKKLLAEKPLKKLLPVDEYIPIMFNNHPNDSWVSHFHDRTLVAWSAAPLLLYPTHYTGDEGYISDTEDSDRIDSVPKPGNDTTDSSIEKKGDKEQINSNTLIDSTITRNEHELSVKNRRTEL